MQTQIQKTARKFAREELVPNAARYDKGDKFPWEILKKAWKIGLMNGCIPSYCGGINNGVFNECIITEELVYGCSGIHSSLGASRLAQLPLIFFANKYLQNEYLGRLIEEPLLAAYSVTEREAGSDVSAIKTTATKKGNEWILNGHKMWIINGGVANWYFVLARTNSDPRAKASKSFTGFIVDRNWPGVQPGRKEEMLGERASDVRGITFEDVRVPKENIVGSEGSGFKIVMTTFDASRSFVAAAASGLAWRALDEAVKYANQRKTFGVPIASHQAVAFMLAEMAIHVECSKLAWRKTAWDFDVGKKNTYSAAIAKCYNADIANKCASDAVQIFGGNGYNKEHPVEKLMRDAKILQIYEGTSQIQRLIIGRHIIENTKMQ